MLTPEDVITDALVDDDHFGRSVPRFEANRDPGWKAHYWDGLQKYFAT